MATRPGVDDDRRHPAPAPSATPAGGVGETRRARTCRAAGSPRGRRPSRRAFSRHQRSSRSWTRPRRTRRRRPSRRASRHLGSSLCWSSRRRLDTFKENKAARQDGATGRPGGARTCRSSRVPPAESPPGRRTRQGSGQPMPAGGVGPGPASRAEFRVRARRRRRRSGQAERDAAAGRPDRAGRRTSPSPAS